MKQRIPYLLFLFSAIFSYAQVTLAVSEVKNPKVNQRFNLTVILEISGENMEQETPLRMPDLSKFDIIGSASEQNTIVLDAKKGNVLNQMIYQWVLTPRETGRVKFGSVLVTVNGKIYKTEPFEINVRDNDAKSSVATQSGSKEVYLQLEVKDKSVYINEPVVATLRAYSQDYGNFLKVSNIQYPQHKNANIKPINFTKSEIETHGGVASQIIGKFLIFPTKSGTVEIPSISALVSNSSKPFKISTGKVRLNVKKFPSGTPENFKNAVGKFDIAVNNTKPNEVAEMEKPVNISVKISGSGNFGNFVFPQMINSPDYIFYTPQMQSKTTANRNGLNGNMTANYIVIPKKAGPISINFENFNFFDPAAKKYVDLGTKSIILNVKTHSQVVDGKSTIEKVNDYTNTVLETVNTPVLQTQNLKIKNKEEINWKVVAGNLGLIAAVISLVLFVNKRSEKKKIKQVHPVKSVTTIAETEEVIRRNLHNPFTDNIEYLKKLREENEFSKFFLSYQDLNAETKSYFSAENESQLRKILEQKKGAHLAEHYRDLSEKIQIEKYAPLHTEEQIDAILKSIITLYAEIVK